MTVQLTWYGHSAFKLESGEHSVLIDPFISGNPSASVDAADVNAETILLTHAHNDMSATRSTSPGETMQPSSLPSN